MKWLILIGCVAVFTMPRLGLAQPIDYIERSYYQSAESQNAALSAARYAEEAYQYSLQAGNRPDLSDFRADVDTVLFYIRKSDELAESALSLMLPNDTVEYLLKTGVKRLSIADEVLRHVYPFNKLARMQAYVEAVLSDLMHAKIDFFKASLHLAKDLKPDEEDFQYQQLETDFHVARLDADEQAFTRLLLDLEEKLTALNERIKELQDRIAQTTDPDERARLEQELAALLAEKERLDDLFLKANKQMQKIRVEQDDTIAGESGGESTGQGSEGSFETDRHGYYDDRNVGINEPLPEGLVYRIQLGYFFKADGQDAFHGLFPITGEDLGDGKIRYYAGMFTSYEDASRAKAYIREKRIGDAFVVPYLDGKKINIKRAIEAEQELNE
ncbi:MAG: hypothetical protein EA392_04725 [Cryomorphaceae bacterium]|nr:MAG: hypothetical protein EA392_04725 [Cryomorphaceae bacterium]